MAPTDDQNREGRAYLELLRFERSYKIRHDRMVRIDRIGQLIAALWKGKVNAERAETR